MPSGARAWSEAASEAVRRHVQASSHSALRRGRDARDRPGGVRRRRQLRLRRRLPGRADAGHRGARRELLPLGHRARPGRRCTSSATSPRPRRRIRSGSMRTCSTPAASPGASSSTSTRTRSTSPCSTTASRAQLHSLLGGTAWSGRRGAFESRLRALRRPRRRGAYWASSDNVMKPLSITDEGGQVTPTVFRAALAAILPGLPTAIAARPAVKAAPRDRPPPPLRSSAAPSDQPAPSERGRAESAESVGSAMPPSSRRMRDDGRTDPFTIARRRPASSRTIIPRSSTASPGILDRRGLHHPRDGPRRRTGARGGHRASARSSASPTCACRSSTGSSSHASSRRSRRTPRVLLYSGVSDQGLVSEALDAGARGFALKDAPLEDLGTRDRHRRVRRPLHRPRSRRRARVHAAAPTCGRRSPSVSVRCCACSPKGGSYAEIGSTLHLSPDTIRAHAQRAMTKLGARTRTAGRGGRAARRPRRVAARHYAAL